MNFVTVNSHDELLDKIKDREQAYLLLYIEGSEKSFCALDNIRDCGKDELEIMTADVSRVRDIHERYGISTAPSLIVFQDGKMKNVVKGCHDKSYFRSVFEQLVNTPADSGSQKSVTVYTTPSCSWCNTLKTYLRQHGIAYQEIDVSRDPKLAEELVSRTGQQGVPQINIGGEWIVGFNKNRINSLLGIQ